MVDARVGDALPRVCPTPGMTGVKRERASPRREIWRSVDSDEHCTCKKTCTLPTKRPVPSFRPTKKLEPTKRFVHTHKNPCTLIPFHKKTCTHKNSCTLLPKRPVPSSCPPKSFDGWPAGRPSRRGWPAAQLAIGQPGTAVRRHVRELRTGIGLRSHAQASNSGVGPKRQAQV